jgi:hypothetical protein
MSLDAAHGIDSKKGCLFSERQGKQKGGCVEKKEEGKAKMTLGDDGKVHTHSQAMTGGGYAQQEAWAWLQRASLWCLFYGVSLGGQGSFRGFI